MAGYPRSFESSSANFSLKSQAFDDTAPLLPGRSYVMYGRLHVSRFGYACSICSTRNCVLHRAHTHVYYGGGGGGRLSCTARLSSSKAGVVSTCREYSRTTHRINKIYPWTTHVRLSYFKNLPPHSRSAVPLRPLRPRRR